MFPAGALNMTKREKQATRYMKCQCGECGYLARVTRKWIESAGEPVCPTDKVGMTCEAIDDEEEEGE